MKWPDLKLSPINLWNIPKVTLNRCILDKIEDETFRHFIRFRGKYPQNLYLGDIEYKELINLLPSPTELNLNIIQVKKETYLKVG